MKSQPFPLKKPSRIAALWRRLRGQSPADSLSVALAYFYVPSDAVKVLTGPEDYRETLLSLIAKAKERIYIASLYLQDDEAGCEILSALYAAKKERPELDIAIFVDWHRAQRGLIGKANSPGNAALYKEMAARFGPGVSIYGVPVQRREFLGVMHLKGFIFDDHLLYSGASLNNVYLQQEDRYRIDRYHLIDYRPLADSFVDLLKDFLLKSPAVIRLDEDKTPKTAEIREQILNFRRELSSASYSLDDAKQNSMGAGKVKISPLIGLGNRRNRLNRVILELIRQAETQIILFTPYFNLPGSVRRLLDAQLKKGCRVDIVLGDKTANDFYIPPDEPFKTIGALPYLYEINLRRFCKIRQLFIDSGRLNVHLWSHGQNSFHLKGLLVDDRYALLTGNNINPRAWGLDLENGLLIHDPQKLLLEQHTAECDRILSRTKRLAHYSDIEETENYALPIQRLIKRLTRVRADRLINRLL